MHYFPVRHADGPRRRGRSELFGGGALKPAPSRASPDRPLWERFAAADICFGLIAYAPGAEDREFLLSALEPGTAFDRPGWLLRDLVRTPAGRASSRLVELPNLSMRTPVSSLTAAVTISDGNAAYSVVAEGKAGARWLQALARDGYRTTAWVADNRGGGHGRIDDEDLEQSFSAHRLDIGEWGATLSGPQVSRVRLRLTGLLHACAEPSH